MLLIESQILPPYFVLSEAVHRGGLLIEECENYQKKSLRNKFFTSSAQGLVYSSIPLKKGKSNKLPITDVNIAYDTEWINDIGKMLTTNYSGAAYFKHYYDDLMNILNSRYEKLFDLNKNLQNWLLVSAQLDLKVSYTKSYKREPDGTICDWRNKSLSFYKNHSSKYQLVYNQIFEQEHGFISNLSTLDLLFNRGPETGYLIKQSTK